MKSIHHSFEFNGWYLKYLVPKVLTISSTQCAWNLHSQFNQLQVETSEERNHLYWKWFFLLFLWWVWITDIYRAFHYIHKYFNWLRDYLNLICLLCSIYVKSVSHDPKDSSIQRCGIYRQGLGTNSSQYTGKTGD